MNQGFFGKVLGQIFEFVKNLTPGKKAGLVVTTIGVVLGTFFMFRWAGETTFKPLMGNLNPEDAANVIRVLREKKIPFIVDSSGRNVSVPQESLYEFRLELASMGMPQASVVGYEVFDKQTLGTTSFVQKLNQKRALEGELIRTINTIKGVKRARVHLALPQKSAFVEDQKKPSASVIVDLEPGTVLTEKQVYGVGNLIAKAVEGLELSDVAIVDSSGKTLSKNHSDSISGATMGQLDFRQKVERDLETRVEEMLSRVVGEGHVVAKVNATVDFSQVNETQTVFDGDGSAVKSQQTDSTSAEGTRPGPAGLPGVQSNTPGQPAPVAIASKTDTKRNSEVKNYEVPQTIRKTQKQSGTLQKISVAVVVDGKTVKTTDKDGKVLSKVDPWPAEKLKEFEQIVASAVGIDKKRGDSLEIRNMEFAREDFDEAERMIAANERKAYVQNLITYSVIGMIVALFFLFVIRPFVKWVTENTIDSVDSFLPQTLEELEKMQRGATLPGLEEVVPVLPERVDPEKVEGEMIKEKIVTLVDSNPHKAALILREWLHSSSSTRAPKDEGGSGKSKSA